MGMSDVHIDIENRLLNGVHPSIVAKELNIPVNWVYPVLKQLERKVLQSNTEVYSPFVTVNS